MEWLSQDDVSEAELPEWAKVEGRRYDGGRYAVRALAEGLVLRRGTSASAVPWDAILVPIRLEKPARLLVATARRPPSAPWFELRGKDLDELEAAIQTRLEGLEHRGYRGARRTREPLTPDEIFSRVLSHEPLPGAVEIPAATPSILKSSIIGGTAGSVTVGFYGMMFGAAGLVIGGLIGAGIGAGIVGGAEVLRKRSAGRVLVLTPDGFVGGLDGQSVRAFGWSQVSQFAVGDDGYGRPALLVLSNDSPTPLARVAARWFGEPVEVIVAVAEAYRKRATADR